MDKEKEIKVPHTKTGKYQIEYLGEVGETYEYCQEDNIYIRLSELEDDETVLTDSIKVHEVPPISMCTYQVDKSPDGYLKREATKEAFYYEGTLMDAENDCEELEKKIVKIAKDYHQSQLQALKQRLDDYKAHPIVKRRNGEEFKLYGFISIEQAKRIITDLEDNGN